MQAKGEMSSSFCTIYLLAELGKVILGKHIVFVIERAYSRRKYMLYFKMKFRLILFQSRLKLKVANKD